MPKTVDLDRLAQLLADYRYAFFVTVGEDRRAHTTAVVPSYADGVFDIGTVGRHGRANLAACPDVTLVWPAADVHAYSLIVDGTAALPDDPDAWLARAEEVPGSWWPGSLRWARSNSARRPRRSRRS